MNRNVMFDIDKSRFNYRVAGVVIEDGYVLLHCFEGDDYWFLPGGRCEIGEPSDHSVVREFAEELGVNVRAERLIWIVENFFDFEGTAFHEIGMYYKVSFEDPSLFGDKTRTYEGVEGDCKLLYKWFPLAKLAHVNLKPAFLQDRLRMLPETSERIVNRDDT